MAPIEYMALTHEAIRKLCGSFPNFRERLDIAMVKTSQLGNNAAIDQTQSIVARCPLGRLKATDVEK